MLISETHKSRANKEVNAPVQEEVSGFIEEVVWPQYGGTWGRWRRRGAQILEDPDMFLKSSLSLLVLKVGSSTPLSLS